MKKIISLILLIFVGMAWGCQNPIVYLPLQPKGGSYAPIQSPSDSGSTGMLLTTLYGTGSYAAAGENSGFGWSGSPATAAVLTSGYNGFSSSPQWYMYNSIARSNGANAQLYFTVTLDHPTLVNSLTVYTNFQMGALSYTASGNVYFQLLINGTWTTIASYNNTQIWSAFSQYTWGPYSGTWDSVSAARLYVNWTHSNDSSSIYALSVTCSSLNINGYNYDSLGLKVQTSSGTVALGAVNPARSTAKLKMRVGASTVELPLVSPSNYDASPVRFYDGSTIWSIAQVVG